MTAWPLLDSLREQLGASLSPESIASLYNRPTEAMQILQRAVESTRPQTSLTAPAGATRPYIGTNSGSLLRSAFVRGEAPFEGYLSGIGSDLILFPEIAINDAVTGILQNEEWDSKALSSIAPSLLHLLSALSPLIDRGYVHVIAPSQENNEATLSIYHALYKAVFSDESTLSLGSHRRAVQGLADAIATATFFPAQLQVYLTPKGFELYEQAILGSSSHVSSRVMVTPPRVGLRVPSPENVTIGDILQIRDTGQVTRWMAELDQAVAACSQYFPEGVNDNDLVAFVQDRLRSGYDDLRSTIERLKLRSAARVGVREIAIGLIASLPGVYWSPELYAQMASGSTALAAINLARTLRSNSSKKADNMTMLHHYEAFITSAEV